MENIATIYWGAVLANQDGLVVAADWDIDFGKVSLGDFNEAYNPLLNGLRREGVPAELVEQLVLDPTHFQETPAGEKNRAIRAALRNRGKILRDSIAKAIYKRAAPFASSEEATDRVRTVLVRMALPSEPVAITEPKAPSPPKRIIKVRPKPPIDSAQKIIDQIRKSDREIYAKIKKGLAVINLPGRLSELVENFKNTKPDLRRRALLYMIQGLDTTLWRSFKQILDHLIFRSTNVFSEEHVEALRSLDRETTFEDIREFSQHLLRILQKRKGDLFAKSA